MLHLALAASLLLPAPALSCPQDDELPPIDPKVLEAAIVDLDAGLKSKLAEERSAAILRNSELDHPEIIERIHGALKDDSSEVVGQALGALRWMQHPEALERLHRSLRKDKRIQKQPELLASLLQAVAQHQDPSSVELLEDDVFKNTHRDVVRARILGLGHIRTTDSVEALIGLLKKTDSRKLKPHMESFRVSLMVLTGADHGLASSAWIAWWNDNKKKLEVSAVAPLLPKKEQASWNRYWGYDYDMGRGRKREERGNDPEKDA